MIDRDTNGYKFYSTLKELCEDKGISPSAVLRSLGYSPTSLKNWKEGGDITTSIVMKIAKYFDVTPNYMFGIKNDDDPAVRIKLGNVKIKEISVCCPYCNLYYEGKGITMQQINYIDDMYKAEYVCPKCERPFRIKVKGKQHFIEIV